MNKEQADRFAKAGCFPQDPHPHTVWRLTWTDGVANDWTEEYPSKDLAELRLAELLRCVENNRGLTDRDAFVEFFTREDDDWTPRVDDLPLTTNPDMRAANLHADWLDRTFPAFIQGDTVFMPLSFVEDLCALNTGPGMDTIELVDNDGYDMDRAADPPHIQWTPWITGNDTPETETIRPNRDGLYRIPWPLDYWKEV